ncbi:hypothetical protein C8046_11920 [Serinibacter arcticus]|uniref:Uncharacterized protein n=2 Tax=Serinibacter arcticus TaxID=1655435 RepID=A0A2U1ZW89_9MICO|nr:hypothetical protein C8046_11920 [Serinibacter arcticus]
MAHADHPDNASLEVVLPHAVLATLGHDWDRVPWAFEMPMLEAPEWGLVLAATRLLDGEAPLRDTAEVRHWLDWLRAKDVVLDHEPGVGFRYVARRDVDVGIVRRRDPEPGPCVRVIGLTSGTGGCLTHGLAHGRPPGQLVGCRLVPAVVCDLCWRVAHVQLPPRSFMPYAYSEACLRCRTAWDLLPEWVTRPRPGFGRRLRPGVDAVSRETLLPLMALGHDGERTAVPWAPALVRTVRDGELVDVDTTAGREPEEVVVWSTWAERYPTSIETSAHAVVALARRLVPDGMPLEVDARTVVGQVRFELDDEGLA